MERLTFEMICYELKTSTLKQVKFCGKCNKLGCFAVEKLFGRGMGQIERRKETERLREREKKKRERDRQTDRE